MPAARLAPLSLDGENPTEPASFGASLLGGGVVPLTENVVTVRTGHGWLVANPFGLSTVIPDPARIPDPSVR